MSRSNKISIQVVTYSEAINRIQAAVTCYFKMLHVLYLNVQENPKMEKHALWTVI